MTDETASTGHARHLREALRAARKALGLTQEDVARRIVERLDDGRSLTGGAVSEWERFQRHPAVDVMSAWAGSVGLHLVVELDQAEGRKIPVMLHERTVAAARELDLMSDEDFEIVRSMISRMARR